MKYVYSTFCTWHGPIDKVGTLPNPASTFLTDANGVQREILGPGLPCCPYCRSPLFELPGKADWQEMIDNHAKTHPGYDKFVAWLGEIPRCYRDYEAALPDFEKEKGIKVKLR